MTDFIINIIIAGLLGGIAISFLASMISTTNTTGWDATVVMIFNLIPTAAGIGIIVGIFVLLTKLRGAA